MNKEWGDVFRNMTLKELNELPFLKEFPDHFPNSLKHFIQSCEQMSLNRSQEITESTEIPLEMRRNISAKKLHEISNMATVVSSLYNKNDCDLVIDIGAGLGYVSELLSKVYNIPVVTLEGNESHAEKAAKKLESSKIKVYTLRIDDSQLVREKLKNIIEENNSNNTCVIGLHCCGDLTVNILRLCSQINVSLVCLVSCCYHRMSKWPMSSKLTSIFKGPLSLYGLRLGAQETRIRWLNQTENDHETHVRNVLYRAVLELFLKNKGMETLKKTKRRLVRREERLSFAHYIDDVINRTEFSSLWKEEITQLYRECEEAENMIEPITCLQVMLQSVIETLILIDRVYFLKENGSYDVNLLNVFDDKISPRNVAIVMEAKKML
ncbi:DgyrCDS11674 [Dimorphilus gyrociliatus]|uniref:DgyrCDS11674 n=1 Tax=Dimorphilus gyrociliatus TaxID=2664684 RepID=A0A7I8W443_9ANNE|nr:DgyrCDS11674 [Dimorphilus gyrociliatus]